NYSIATTLFSLSRSFLLLRLLFFFFFHHTATTEIYTLSLHDALPISSAARVSASGSRPRMTRSARTFCTCCTVRARRPPGCRKRSEEHTSELQSLRHLVCRLLLEKKKQ